MNERAISLCYGASSGAAMVALGVPTLAVVTVGMCAGLAMEFYGGYTDE